VEAFDLAVGAGSVGPGGEMADAVASEQLAQGAVLDVAEGVVGQQSFGDDAVVGEAGERAFDEAGHGCGCLVVVELDVGES
jgi:hypothetical protein